MTPGAPRGQGGGGGGARDGPGGAPRRPAVRDAREEALRLLEARPRTRADLRRRLLRRGHSSDEIDMVLERLAGAGLVDDSAYGRQFARSRLEAARTAPARIERDLVQRGLDRRTAATAVQDVLADEPVDMAAIVDTVVQRRAVLLAGLDERTRRRRLYAYLARRGFDADDIRRALRALTGARE